MDAWRDGRKQCEDRKYKEICFQRNDTSFPLKSNVKRRLFLMRADHSGISSNSCLLKFLSAQMCTVLTLMKLSGSSFIQNPHCPPTASYGGSHLSFQSGLTTINQCLNPFSPLLLAVISLWNLSGPPPPHSPPPHHFHVQFELSSPLLITSRSSVFSSFLHHHQ